jgi:hypothetical protein
MILALVPAAFAVPASAQTSVDIRTGPNGQLSGSATAGGASSSVDTGRQDGDRAWAGHGARSEARCTGNGRTMTVTSPDGSSSSSVSTSSSGDGTVAVTGGGSRGSRVTEGGCQPVGRDYGRPTSSAAYGAQRGSTASYVTGAVAGGTRHRTTHHRRRHARRR